MTEIMKKISGVGGGGVTFRLGVGDSVADLRLEAHGAGLVVYLGHWECSRLASEAAARAQGVAADYNDPFEVDTMSGVERVGQTAGKVTFTTVGGNAGCATIRVEDGDGGMGEIELDSAALTDLALALSAAVGEM